VSTENLADAESPKELRQLQIAAAEENDGIPHSGRHRGAGQRGPAQRL